MRFHRCVLSAWLCVVPAFDASSRLSAQDEAIWDNVPDVPEVVRFFAPFVPQKLIADITGLKEAIRSAEFDSIRNTLGDLRAVNWIFGKALCLSWGNLYEALAITTIAVMDHRRFGIRVPLVGSIWFPLTSEHDDEFVSRRSALPGRFSPGSPEGAAGDRDKLQHFFGSALLTFAFESSGAASRVGSFIEWGEELFVVDGMLDERDEWANRQGRRFGYALLRGEPALPSHFLEGDTTRDENRSGR